MASEPAPDEGDFDKRERDEVFLADLSDDELREFSRRASDLAASVSRQIAPLVAAMAPVTDLERRLRTALAPALEQHAAASAVLRRMQPAFDLPQISSAFTLEVAKMRDWHRRIDEIQKSLAPSAALLGRLQDIATGYLPGNLQGLRLDWHRVLDISKEDGISLAWAPRQEIVEELIGLDSREAREELLHKRQDEVLDDVSGSLALVTHPALVELADLLDKAADAVRAGHAEAAQALIANVLETTMKNHANAWIRRTFPSAEYRGAPGTGHHRTLASATSGPDNPRDLTLLQFNHYLVLRGMTDTFQGSVSTQETFNRHLSCHQASHDTYRSGFVLPSLLLTQALLRVMDQALEPPEEPR
ncbi:hypothetical protein [Streptomyces sp. NPDC087300]|uniref:hypothetical protein n=1 Tax=Streptomyces sp. NPDC087300 TaxID=3365780 RepID=UPI0037F943D1